MKKFALSFCLLFFIVSVKSQTTVAVLIDSDHESDAKLVKTAVELRLGFTGKVRLNHFPAKLQLSASMMSVKYKQEIIGYAVSYTFTEGIFYKGNPRLILLDSGVIVAPDLPELVNILVEDFEKVLDQPRL